MNPVRSYVPLSVLLLLITTTAFAEIKVVKTWEELQAQPELALPEGRARLGIEASSGPVNSGLLVYCLTEGYQVVASAEVTITEDPLHPRMPLERGPRDHDVQRWPNAEVQGVVRNRKRGIAIPCFEGMNPIGYEADRFPKDLPPLFPPQDDQLRITPRGNSLLLESHQEIILARPDWHFLARWWINDKPYVPPQMEPFVDQNGQILQGKTMQLDIAFDPKAFEVKSGDKVDVQLLYCLNGWGLVIRDMEMLSHHANTRREELLLSNRVELNWE